jgi:predicted DNA-binding transcriptional regulator AlpA
MEMVTILGDIRAALVEPAAEGLNAAEAAAFLGISRSAFDELDARGMVPEGATLGAMRGRRWARTELRAWLLAGSPVRSRWQSMRESAIRRVG